MRRDDGFIFILVPLAIVGLVLIIITVATLGGCATQQQRSIHDAERAGVSAPAQAVTPGEGGLARVAVLDFSLCCVDRSPTDPPHVDSDPLTGLTFTIGYTPAESGEIVADRFRSKLVEQGFNLIPDTMVDEAITELPANLNETERAAAIGQAIDADAVFAGRVMRYGEREGTQLAASNPASVAFSVAAIRPADGAILWKAKFDKTQKALFDDMREIGSFVKGGFVWQSAIELTELGVGEVVARMPLRPAKR